MKGFNRAGIYNMKQFYEAYKYNEIVFVTHNTGKIKSAETIGLK
jgi:hypothetical protein